MHVCTREHVRVHAHAGTHLPACTIQSQWCWFVPKTNKRRTDQLPPNVRETACGSHIQPRKPSRNPYSNPTGTLMASLMESCMGARDQHRGLCDHLQGLRRHLAQAHGARRFVLRRRGCCGYLSSKPTPDLGQGVLSLGGVPRLRYRKPKPYTLNPQSPNPKTISGTTPKP